MWQEDLRWIRWIRSRGEGADLEEYGLRPTAGLLRADFAVWMGLGGALGWALPPWGIDTDSLFIKAKWIPAFREDRGP